MSGLITYVRAAPDIAIFRLLLDRRKLKPTSFEHSSLQNASRIDKYGVELQYTVHL